MKIKKEQPARYSEIEARMMLQREILRAGSQAKFAVKHGLSEASVSLINSGKRPISEAVSKALGLRRVRLIIHSYEVLNV